MATTMLGTTPILSFVNSVATERIKEGNSLDITVCKFATDTTFLKRLNMCSNLLKMNHKDSQKFPLEEGFSALMWDSRIDAILRMQSNLINVMR